MKQDKIDLLRQSVTDKLNTEKELIKIFDTVMNPIDILRDTEYQYLLRLMRFGAMNGQKKD